MPIGKRNHNLDVRFSSPKEAKKILLPPKLFRWTPINSYRVASLLKSTTNEYKINVQINYKQNYKPGFELFVRLELHWCQLAPSQELACYGQPTTRIIYKFYLSIQGEVVYDQVMKLNQLV